MPTGGSGGKATGGSGGAGTGGEAAGGGGGGGGGDEPKEESGCGCRAAGSEGGEAAPYLALLAGLVIAGRRRARKAA